MHSSNQKRKPPNQISVCLQKQNGSTQQEVVVHNRCSPGVTITFVIEKVACWQTLNRAAVIIPKMVDSIPFALMLTGQTISVCIAWQETWPSGHHLYSTKALIISSTI